MTADTVKREGRWLAEHVRDMDDDRREAVLRVSHRALVDEARRVLARS